MTPEPLPMPKTSTMNLSTVRAPRPRPLLMRAELYALSAALPSAVGAVRTKTRCRQGLLLRLCDEQGRTGWGEASPLPGFSREDLPACQQALAVLPWSRLSLDDPDAGALARSLDDRLGPLPAAARCAVETALCDLHAQRRGEPVASLLGRVADPARSSGPPQAVAVSALVGGESLAAVCESADAALRRGVRTLKLKLGRPGRTDFELQAARALRERLGPGGGLRLDGNRAFSRDEAQRLLPALAELSPEFIEEPLADPRELVALRSPIAVALDESLGELAVDALRPLFASGAASVAVLKPMALGGPLSCLALLERLFPAAEDRRAAACVTHFFDGTVGCLLALQLAAALRPVRACGLDAHAGLALGPQAVLPAVAGGVLQPPLAPGLGLVLDGAVADLPPGSPLWTWQPAERGAR
ncbi:MAG: enolase C-terminal domain-like protein [Polyangia bacterium]